MFGRIDRVFGSESCKFHSFQHVGDKTIDGLNCTVSDHYGICVCVVLDELRPPAQEEGKGKDEK